MKALKKIAFSPLFSRAYKNLIEAGEEITGPALYRAERQRLYNAVSKGMRRNRLNRFKRTTRDIALPGAGLAALGVTAYGANS